MIAIVNKKIVNRTVSFENELMPLNGRVPDGGLLEVYTLGVFIVFMVNTMKVIKNNCQTCNFQDDRVSKSDRQFSSLYTVHKQQNFTKICCSLGTYHVVASIMRELTQSLCLLLQECYRQLAFRIFDVNR